ncbi:MAG: cysteine--tRNA ligase [Candidatus Omnitrophica bacterium]|nr:cysteine--tRNA ligase [Candidatus Omnitrophota bacterium]
MPLKLTNTLTGKKEEFQPLNPPRVTMYVCGVTVYDHCHIGHARGAVVFDVLRRYLEGRCGFQVKHVRNITDVDDKLIDRARDEASGSDLKRAVQELAQRHERSFQEDFRRLGLLAPTHEPRATEFIDKMVRFIETLLARGIAYEGADGVHFSVRKLEGYGKLSHQSLDALLEGVRVDPGEGKKEPLDFALWKKAKPDEPSWPSPWGEGRPGWHIECSAMSTELLGDTFDIHGGGIDLIFPHHENELAQAAGAGKKFARLWLHNGLLTVNGQKMSKSLGNFVTIDQVLQKHLADVLRLFFLSAHYRSPLDFTWDRLDVAARSYEGFTIFLRHASALGPLRSEDINMAKNSPNWKSVQKLFDDFYESMDNDLNTPEAIAVLHSFDLYGNMSLRAATVKERETRHACVRVVRDKFLEFSNLLGFSMEIEDAVPLEVDKLVEEREKFRQGGQYSMADFIRKQLLDLGWVVEDTSGKTIVRKRV